VSRPVEDHTAIERLLASYALRFDSEDVTGCAQLFTDECEFLLNGVAAATGREGVAGWFADVIARGAGGIHLPGPPLIDVAADGRTATIWQSFLFVANGSNVVVRGMYRDVAERSVDGWRFQKRAVEMFPAPPSD
jgi:ketosteroid isomerase-like protein